jgi:hypothetical protein
LIDCGPLARLGPPDRRRQRRQSIEPIRCQVDRRISELSLATRSVGILGSLDEFASPPIAAKDKGRPMQGRRTCGCVSRGFGAGGRGWAGGSEEFQLSLPQSIQFWQLPRAEILIKLGKADAASIVINRPGGGHDRLGTRHLEGVQNLDSFFRRRPADRINLSRPPRASLNRCG